MTESTWKESSTTHGFKVKPILPNQSWSDLPVHLWTSKSLTPHPLSRQALKHVLSCPCPQNPLLPCQSHPNPKVLDSLIPTIKVPHIHIQMTKMKTFSSKKTPCNCQLLLLLQPGLHKVNL